MHFYTSCELDYLSQEPEPEPSSDSSMHALCFALPIHQGILSSAENATSYRYFLFQRLDAHFASAIDRHGLVAHVIVAVDGAPKRRRVR